MDQPYDTYILDMQHVREFKPNQIPNLDLFDFSIPLLKYIS